jgi:hypothetical protein
VYTALPALMRQFGVDPAPILAGTGDGNGTFEQPSN